MARKKEVDEEALLFFSLRNVESPQTAKEVLNAFGLSRGSCTSVNAQLKRLAKMHLSDAEKALITAPDLPEPLIEARIVHVPYQPTGYCVTRATLPAVARKYTADLQAFKQQIKGFPFSPASFEFAVLLTRLIELEGENDYYAKCLQQYFALVDKGEGIIGDDAPSARLPYAFNAVSAFYAALVASLFTPYLTGGSLKKTFPIISSTRFVQENPYLLKPELKEEYVIFFDATKKVAKDDCETAKTQNKESACKQFFNRVAARLDAPEFAPLKRQFVDNPRQSAKKQMEAAQANMRFVYKLI